MTHPAPNRQSLLDEVERADAVMRRGMAAGTYAEWLRARAALKEYDRIHRKEKP